MKKFAFVIGIILLSCGIFFGCGQRLPSSNEFILLSVSSDSVGQVTQSLHFSLGSKKLTQAGASTLDVVNVKNKLITEVGRFHDEFLINFALIYSADTSENKSDYQIGKGLVISEVTYNEQADTVGFNMTFANNKVWNFYHPKSSDGEDNSKVEYGFIVTSSSKGLFPFAGEMKISGTQTTVAERYMNAYTQALSACTDIKMEYKPDLVYDYGTAEGKIKSDSEYFFVDEQGINHHVWMRSSDEYKEKNSIELYIRQANRGLWYAVALGGVLITLAGAIVIIKIMKKKQSKN